MPFNGLTHLIIFFSGLSTYKLLALNIPMVDLEEFQDSAEEAINNIGVGRRLFQVISPLMMMPWHI